MKGIVFEICDLLVSSLEYCILKTYTYTCTVSVKISPILEQIYLVSRDLVRKTKYLFSAVFTSGHSDHVLIYLYFSYLQLLSILTFFRKFLRFQTSLHMKCMTQSAQKDIEAVSQWEWCHFNLGKQESCRLS